MPGKFGGCGWRGEVQGPDDGEGPGFSSERDGSRRGVGASGELG